MLDLLFWLSFFYWTVLPSTKTPWFEIESIPVNGKDILLVVVACIFLFWPRRKKTSSTALPRRENLITAFLEPWHYHLPILTLSLIFYATLSLQDSRLDPRDAKGMMCTLILTASSFLLGYNAIAKRPAASVRLFLWRLTVGLAGVGLLYTVASLSSFQFAGVRTALINDPTVRVQGPLFGSDDGYFVLIPALAFAIQELIQTPTQRLFKLTIIFILMLTLIGLGSRGAILIIGVFLCLTILFNKNKKVAALAALGVIVFVMIAAAIVFATSNTGDRLQSLEDSSRSDTYLTSFKIMGNRTTDLNILGSGYGSYWDWYILDLEDGSDAEGGRTFKIIRTSFGPILYHPHSTFLLLIVELGMAGFLYFVFLWTVYARLLLRDSRKLEFPILGCGILASGFSLFMNFFIFRLQMLTCLWWIFLFGALALSSSASSCGTQNTIPPQEGAQFARHADRI
ncbi:O-antigen ligase family protein [Microcoleus sp. Pol8_C1]